MRAVSDRTTDVFAQFQWYLMRQKCNSVVAALPDASLTCRMVGASCQLPTVILHVSIHIKWSTMLPMLSRAVYHLPKFSVVASCAGWRTSKPQMVML